MSDNKIDCGGAGNSLDTLIEKATNKLKEYDIDFMDREEAYKCFDRCCFPKGLKDAYEIERCNRGSE